MRTKRTERTEKRGRRERAEMRDIRKIRERFIPLIFLSQLTSRNKNMLSRI